MFVLMQNCSSFAFPISYRSDWTITTTKAGIFHTQWRSPLTAIKTTMTMAMTNVPMERDEAMDTPDSLAADIPSDNDVKDRNAKIEKAINKYISNLANDLGKTEDDLKGIVPELLYILGEDEFWNKKNDRQREGIEVTTTNFLRRSLNISVKPSVFSTAVDSLLTELSSLNVVSADSRIVPVDYHISDTNLRYKFDLDKFVEQIQSVTDEWDATKDTENIEEKYIAPYFCFIQSSGMGKTKLMYEFAKLTRMTSYGDHEGTSYMSDEFSCDLILSGDVPLEKEVPESDVFDGTLDLRSFVTDTGKKASTAAKEIYDYLEAVLVNNRSTSRRMKKTHVFLFDEAQVLLRTHYEFEAFLFRCIRTWLRKKRNDTTVIAVFSGTSSAILNYSIKTDLLKDSELEKISPSRGLEDEQFFYSRGSRTFEPFFTLTTMAVLKPKEEIPNQSDYEKSIRYGRPLFAKMHEKNELEEKIETILRRLLLDTGKDGFEWTQHTQSLLSVLATRVQMGSTNISVVSSLVARGYANLVGVTTNTATFAYMPDPVCARLAMCMMDDEWSLSKWHGKPKKWWSAAVKTLYSSGLCLPDKGDMGEVLTVLYFLFCCDECRQNIDDNKDYTAFSVPLNDWIDALLTVSNESRTGSAGKRICKPSGIRVNFIQVCRDYTRSLWTGLADQGLLEMLYNAGTACYTYPGCDSIDFVAPTVITTPNTTPTHSSVLVSIKSRLYFSPGDAAKECAYMKNEADERQLKSVLCILCVFGQTSTSDDKEYTYDASRMLRELEEGQNVATVLRIPRNDRFGLTDIFLSLTTLTEPSELLSSHMFLRSRRQDLEAKDALRQVEGPRKAIFDYENLMEESHLERKINNLF
jgi:hypothetical protein